MCIRDRGWNIGNLLRLPLIKTIAGDMTAVCCLLMAAIYQGCILCGLIQTNNRYFELFQTSGGLDAEITDCLLYTSKEEYLSYKAEYEKQDKDIRAKIQLAEQEKDSFGEAEESYENWIEKFIKYGTLSEVTREIVTELIEKIVVNGDKSIDIVFKYQSPYPVEKQAV